MQRNGETRSPSRSGLAAILLAAFGVLTMPIVSFVSFAKFLALTAIFLATFPTHVQSSGFEARSYGETIYVPALSRIFTFKDRLQPLASSLVVHNVDPMNSIRLNSVRYYNQSGELVRTFLENPTILAPFESMNFLTELNENAGGVGANYVVEWEASQPALGALAESVMVGGSGTQGISFVIRGRVILQNLRPKSN